MSSKDPAQRWADILDNITLIQKFTGGMSRDEFAADSKSIYAVTRALEIISEASRRLPQEARERHPQIVWAQIAAAGNVYRHEYDFVDPDLLWNTIQSGLPPLRAVAAEELDDRSE